VSNLITNGSFEELGAGPAVRATLISGYRALPGWQLDGAQKDYTNWFEVADSGNRGIKSVDGTHWLDFDANGTRVGISQQVKGVEADKSYTLTLTVASSSPGEGLDIFWGGVKIANVVPSSTQFETVSFVVSGSAEAALNTLHLVGTGPADSIGVALDKVSLVAAPEGVFTPDGKAFEIAAIHEGTAGVDTYSVGADPGRQFFNDFNAVTDRIRIDASIASSFADLQSKAAIYQSEGSAVVEFHNGSDVLVLTQFNASKLSASSFIFEGAPAVTAQTVGGNLIRNGSFENIGSATTTSWGKGATALEGWTLAGTAKANTNWFELANSGVRGITADDGKYWLDLDASSGNISISQAVSNVQTGQYYTLTFSAASSHAGNSVDVYWDGQKLASITPTGKAFQEYSFVVEGHAGLDQNRLTFTGQGTADGNGVSLDDVSLLAHKPVVEPADIHAFGLGSGRLYVTDFDMGIDKIAIHSDLFLNYEQLLDHAAIYQDGRSTIIEFDNGREVIVLPQFDATRISADVFTFEKESKEAVALAKKTVFSGTEKDDTLIFGAGNQTIDAGAGFDIITGGVGADSFVFNAKSGRDFITDFEAGTDKIVISRELAESYDGLLKNAAIYQDGNSTQIEFGNGQLITLYGVNAEKASAEWFTFA
jgi:Ca2+-binding RTX toxin-like protein